LLTTKNSCFENYATLRVKSLDQPLFGLGLISGDVRSWEGTASEFERALPAKDKERILDRVFASATSAGRMLSELVRIESDRVVRKNWNGTTHYRIFPPK
jgi:hypothetical protein